MPRWVPRGTAKVAWWGYGRCPEETRLDDHQSPFWTTGCLRPLYPPNRRQLAIRASFVRPGVDVCADCRCRTGCHLDCRERHTTTHLRMRCCRLSGGTVDNAMNQLL